MLLLQTLRKVSKPALKALRGSLAVPQATLHVLKAALCLLGREPASCATWPLCLQHLTPQLFEDLKSYDATQVGGEMGLKLSPEAPYTSFSGRG